MDFPRYRAITRGALPNQRLRTELRPELNARFVENQSAVSGLAADLARVTSLLAGCGRVLSGDDGRDAATRPQAGAGLTVELPTGWGAVVEGQPVVLAEALALDDVPAGAVSYGYLSLETSDDEPPVLSLAVTWETEKRPDYEAQGWPCVGKVTAGAALVTDVDVSDETTIWSLPLLQKRVRSLSTTGGGGGGEGGGGALFATQLPISETDETSTKSYIDGETGKLDAKIALLGGLDMFPAPFDLLGEAVGALAGGLGEVNPPAIERLQISVIGPNFGHGQKDSPDFTPDTGDPLELPFNPETGSFGF